MANLCSININIPLDKVPDQTEREQLIALYKAGQKWKEAVKTDESLRIGKNRDVFISSQTGVPYRKTQWNNYGGEFTGKSNETLEADNEQWNIPTIGATFGKKGKSIWVQSTTCGRGGSLLFDEADGITMHIPKSEKSYTIPSTTQIPMTWQFKWGFPWWAQVGFAGADKYCDKKSQDPPKGKDYKFYEEWYSKHEYKPTYLLWELSVAKILKNLEYVIKVYENFPVEGSAWQNNWIWEELSQLSKIYKWFKQVSVITPDALAHLDWSEVAWNSMDFKSAREDDEPNQIMEFIKDMERNLKKLTPDQLFEEYCLRTKSESTKARDYLSILERDPFDWSQWFRL